MVGRVFSSCVGRASGQFREIRTQPYRDVSASKGHVALPVNNFENVYNQYKRASESNENYLGCTEVEAFVLPQAELPPCAMFRRALWHASRSSTPRLLLLHPCAAHSRVIASKPSVVQSGAPEASRTSAVDEGHASPPTVASEVYLYAGHGMHHWQCGRD